MTDVPLIQPTLRDLLADVGEVLLRWGFLEQAIREKVGPTTPTDTRTQLHRLRAAGGNDALVAEIESVAVVRHLVAHGMIGAYSQPHHEGEAEVICRNLSGDDVAVTITELHATAWRLDALRRQVQGA